MTGTNDFHVIGYTNEQILEGGIHRLLALDSHILKNNLALNSQLGPLKNAEVRGIVAEESVEVYSIMRAVMPEDNPFPEKPCLRARANACGKRGTKLRYK